MLREAHFLSQPDVDLSDTENVTYLRPVEIPSELTESEILKAIIRIKPDKTLDLDRILKKYSNNL